MREVDPPKSYPKQIQTPNVSRYLDVQGTNWAPNSYKWSSNPFFNGIIFVTVFYVYKWSYFTPTCNYFLGLILRGSIIELNGTSATGPAFAGAHLSSSVFDILDVFSAPSCLSLKRKAKTWQFLVASYHWV